MILLHYIISFFIFIISTKSIHSSVPFILNPGCQPEQCQNLSHSGIFYGSQSVGEDTIHILYSSFDQLTISIIETRQGHVPQINYDALINKNYTDAITFVDTYPLNSFSLILRRLMKFDDPNDTGLINENDTTIQSYWLNQLETNITREDNNNTYQPLFQLPLNDINGLLTIDINYPGESTRDTNFPKLRSTPKSYFLNIALKADGIPLKSTRFALEFYLIQYGIEGMQYNSTKYIDDQYTPGIFNVCQIQSFSPLYSSSMLWKPIVYQSTDRSVDKNTLMNIYDLKNNVILQSSDQGIFRALFRNFYVSAFNISLGRQTDGFFIKSNYSFVQLTAGLDLLERDSITKFVALALIISLALPTLVAAIAIIFIIKRRCTRETITSYDPIDD